MPGAEEPGGDFVRELGMLLANLKSGDAQKDEEEEQELNWQYVCDMTRDEALLIKFFDSKSLGQNSTEADAPWHGSPDVCGDGEDVVRESVEVRVMCFW